MSAKTKVMVIAGTHSGVGKTTVALGIMAALKRRGLSVQPFKVGPDFIDPGHHERICQAASRNLDGWMAGRAATISSFAEHSCGRDVAVIEGVMGLFDGLRESGGDGSTAQIARWLKAAVILVMDARGMSGSAAALVYGFQHYDRRVHMAGVIINRAGSIDHYQWLKTIIEKKCRLPVIGHLPTDSALGIPERHLGLVSAQELVVNRKIIERLGVLFERFLDLDLLLRISSPREKRSPRSPARNAAFRRAAPAVKIGIARDEAFFFYYQDNLDLLRQMGAQLVYFSPLHDAALPGQLDGVYIGGGYPELYARALEANSSMRGELRRFAESGGVIYAECGGLMYLGKSIRTFDNALHAMVGIFPFTAVMQQRLTHLGYYTVRALRSTILARRGERARGHQFRYSRLTGSGASAGNALSIRRGRDGTTHRDGFIYKNVLAQYVHIHFASNRSYARRFVASCHERAKATVGGGGKVKQAGVW